MVGGLASAALILALGVGGPWEARITAHYRPHLMQEVVANRRRRGWDIPRSGCYIAHPTLPIGARVQVKGLNTGAVLGCVVADTSAPADRARHIRAGLIETGYGEAEIICGSTELRNDECPSLVRRMR